MKRLSFALIENKTLKGAAAIHFHSEFEARNSKAPEGVRSVIIPSPVFPPGREPDGAAFRDLFPVCAERQLVVFAGRFSRDKGLETLLRAFALARRRVPEALLVLLGSGPSVVDRAIRAEAERLSLGGSVLFTGFLTGVTKWDALAAADVVVQPSESESFGMTSAEAMTIGRPVLVTDGVGLAESVNDSGGGMVTKRDPEMIAGALAELLENPEQAQAMGRRGEQFARDRFSPPGIASEIDRAYRELV